MKIVMVGKSGSGKTSLLAAIHKKLGRTGIEDISIAPYGRTLVERMTVTDDLYRIGFGDRTFSFPEATTAKPKLWPFELLHASKSVMPFQILDYRGGILDEPIGGNKNELLDHIEMSDAILFVADSSILTRTDLDREDKIIDCGADIIGDVLENFSVTNPEKRVIFIVALSQCDAVDDEWKSTHYERLVNASLDVFQHPLKVCKNNPNWVAGILPTSAVGEGTTVREGKNDVTSDTILRRPNPLNVEHLVFFCLGHLLRHIEDARTTDYIRSQRKIFTAMRNVGFWNSAKAWFNDDPSPETMLKRALEENERNLKALTELQKVLLPLHNIASQKVTYLK